MLRPGAIFNNGPLMASDSKRTIRRLLALTDNYNLSQKNTFQGPVVQKLISVNQRLKF